jgi:uncharacterized protein with HEPN domain
VTDAERIARWLADLDQTLLLAAKLVSRGRSAFDTDPAIPLAFEALSNRVGDLAKKLVAADPARFSDSAWSNAARTRDFVVHHYHRIDRDLLWTTVSVSYPELARLAKAG